MRLYEFIKPIPCYYHGSNQSGITVLEPKYSKLVDADVVFAATLPEIAVLMSGHWTDEDFDFGHDTSTEKETDFTPYTFKELKKGALEKFFRKKIFLYQVPAEYFSTDKNIQDFEVISKKNVPIHSVIEVKDALEYIQNSPYIQIG